MSSTNPNPNPNPWAPPGESPSALWEERSNYYSVPLSAAAYGVHFTLYCIVLQHLVQHPPTTSINRGRGLGKSKVPWGLVAYITWNFFLGTVGIAAEVKFNELTFITDRNFPGGPDAFVADEYGMFINIFGTVAYVVLNWFADGLVIYRFWLIYNFNYYLAIVPCVLLLASISMGVMLLFQLTQPFANLWTTTTTNFAIPYWSISTSLNILVTLLIVGRLLFIRQRTRAVLSTSHARTYTSIAAMLVESAALYSATALVFIVTYARSSNVQNIILPVLGQVQAISPLLIMWRVAKNQAISRESQLEQSISVSRISWKHSTGTGTRSTGAPGAVSMPGTQTRSFGSSISDQPQQQTGHSRDRDLISTPSSYPLSPQVSFQSGVSGKNVGEDESEVDFEVGWEMEERGEAKLPPLEVVVERSVEQWDGDTRIVRGNAL